MMCNICGLQMYSIKQNGKNVFFCGNCLNMLSGGNYATNKR